MRRAAHVLAVLLAACGAKSRHYADDGIGESDADADVDSDADSDTVSDGDTDPDTSTYLDAGPAYDAGPDPGRDCVAHDPNAPPYAPVQLYPTVSNCARVVSPTLKVANASDPDRDTLRYHFDIDRDPGFRSIDFQRTPDDGVPEGISGFTEWRVPRPLVQGETYYWRAWVDDCFEDSERVVSAFDICL